MKSVSTWTRVVYAGLMMAAAPLTTEAALLSGQYTLTGSFFVSDRVGLGEFSLSFSTSLDTSSSDDHLPLSQLIGIAHPSYSFRSDIQVLAGNLAYASGTDTFTLTVDIVPPIQGLSAGDSARLSFTIEDVSQIPFVSDGLYSNTSSLGPGTSPLLSPTITFAPNTVPEPASLSLAAMALVAMGAVWRRRLTHTN